MEGKELGWYLVKTQVLALGGKIEVGRQVNQGTTFKVFLKDEVNPNESMPESTQYIA